jgi:hypothetical protein
MISRRFGLGGLLVALAAAAAAQQIPFQLLVTQGQNAINVQNGSTLTFVAPIGLSQTAQLQATYTGTGQITIAKPPTVFGSPEFKATVAGLPLTVAPGSSFTILLEFDPTTATAAASQLSLSFLETLSTTSSNTGAITLGLQGTAPAFTLSYILQIDQNVVPLQPGGTIPFAATLVGATAQAALNLTDTGSGAGTVTGIAIAGSAFRLQGTPLLPATVLSGQNLQVLVLYTPTAVSKDTGQITITFATGAPVTINLTGSGSSPSLTYQVLNGNTTTAVTPGGTITLPDTNVGQTSSVTMRVLNSGSANGTVSSISFAGQVFQLSNVPVLPQVLTPNASLTFNLNFTPTQPGAQAGTLIVNSDTFKLSGAGLGPLLTFSYVAGATTITLGGANNSVVFSPVQISQSEQLIFDVANTGTLSATISNIGVGQAGGSYSVLGLPPLPVTLAPNADFHITIKFTPTTVGFSNGTLLLDATSIALIGSGTAPPPLPSYTITGPSGNVAPMTQSTVGLTLASAYPVAISGTLTMGIAGNLPADPAVQFATGGRTVSFTIPANQTAAVFGAQGKQVGLQTGTVASNITLTPTFATLTGNVDLTPNAPTLLQFAVAPAAPTLIALQFSGQSATGFTIQVTGFTTTRSLTSLAVQFTTAPGFSLATSQFTINVKPVSTVWFQTTVSQGFGGQFTLAVPFTFQATLPVGQSVLSAIASVSVAMSNETGASNSIQATLQ